MHEEEGRGKIWEVRWRVEEEEAGLVARDLWEVERVSGSRIDGGSVKLNCSIPFCKMHRIRKNVFVRQRVQMAGRFIRFEAVPEKQSKSNQ